MVTQLSYLKERFFERRLRQVVFVVGLDLYLGYTLIPLWGFGDG